MGTLGIYSFQTSIVSITCLFSFQSPGDAFSIITTYKRQKELRLRSGWLILIGGYSIFPKCTYGSVNPLLKTK